MNLHLINRIQKVKRGILATILETEGHTYKKSGEKALYEVEILFPIYGNLGSGCVDIEILSEGKGLFIEGRPKIIKVDMSKTPDIYLGYGTYCGGKMEILLEPLLERHKKLYRNLKEYIEKRECCYLIHNLETGELSISGDLPSDTEDLFIERISLPQSLFIFGATPLAHWIVRYLEGMDFQVGVIDWRKEFIKTFKGVSNVRLYEDTYPFDRNSYVLILSHSFERDKDVLKKALLKGCIYIGLLSSKTRREKIFEELSREGIALSLPKREELRSMFEKVSSPVGIDIKAKDDPEIAISIVAELIKFKNR